MTNEIYDKNGNAASEMTANTAIKKPERISPIEKLTMKIKGPDRFEEQWLYEEIGAIENEFLRKKAEHKMPGTCNTTWRQESGKDDSQSIWQPIINKGKRKSRIDFVW